jgi:hypothetical protein
MPTELRVAVLAAHERLVRLVEQLLLREGHGDVPVALARVDLGDDRQTQLLVLSDVLLPVAQTEAVLRPDDLVHDIGGHSRSYIYL